jgi:hypothetical protein
MSRADVKCEEGENTLGVADLNATRYSAISSVAAR